MTELRGQEIEGPFLQNPFNSNHAAEELPLTFGRVESFLRAGLLEVPAVDPVVAHVDSQQGPDLNALIPPSAKWEDVLEIAGRKVAEIIEADGTFRVTTEVGAFVCRP